MASNKRIVLAFNDFDFRHKKVCEILKARPRNMTEMVVNAVLHYVSCPEAAEEFNKEAIRKIVVEVISEMAASGSLVQSFASVGAGSTQLKPEDSGELSGLMDIFR